MQDNPATCGSEAGKGISMLLPLGNAAKRIKLTQHRHIQADSLRAAVARQLRPFRAFPLTLSGLTCLANDNNSRTFVGIKAQLGKKHVLRMIEAVNRAFSSHGLPAFYEVPIPHVSLAWVPGDEVTRLQPWLEGLEHQPIHLSVNQVICQIGKVKEVVWQAS
eukprot:gene13345-13473_t